MSQYSSKTSPFAVHDLPYFRVVFFTLTCDTCPSLEPLRVGKTSLTATLTRTASPCRPTTETARCVMLNKGQYVRHKMARETLIGTIEGAEIQRGRVFYRFQQDP